MIDRPDLIVDTSAVLAYAFEERGGEAMADLLPRAGICSVNLTEIVSKFVDKGSSGEDARAATAAIGLHVIVADVDLALSAGAMREGTRHLGLSLGDRFCLALGRRTGLPVYTADRRWAELPGVDVRLIR